MAGRIPKVVVAGPVYVDMAIKCDQFPNAGHIIPGGGFSCVLTGPGPNRALQATLCDCETHLLAKVGDDIFGRMAKEDLSERGVKTHFIYTARAISTGIAVTMVDSAGENTGCLSVGANRALTADEVECVAVEQLISSADVCLCNDDLPVEVVKSIIRTSDMYKTRIILDARLDIGKDGSFTEPDWPVEFYTVDVLIPNLHKTSAVLDSGAGSVHKLKLIASELVAKGVKCVVIKMGSRGTLVVDRQGAEQISGFDDNSVASKAYCGDAFAGALAASCGAGDGCIDAVKFASAAAAAAAKKFGTSHALASKDEIIELLQKQAD